MLTDHTQRESVKDKHLFNWMKKTDLVNELAKVTLTKKEALMAVEILLNLIK